MGNRRHLALTKSIQDALLRDPKSFRKTLIGRILAFFSIYYIKLLRHSDDRFRRLRIEVFGIDDEEYRQSFRKEGREPALTPMGDLGFSGSVSILFSALWGYSSIRSGGEVYSVHWYRYC